MQKRVETESKHAYALVTKCELSPRFTGIRDSEETMRRINRADLTGIEAKTSCKT